MANKCGDLTKKKNKQKEIRNMYVKNEKSFNTISLIGLPEEAQRP